MKSLFVVCAVLLSFLASAKIVEVVGSGSGDDFGQALAAAKVNAILKAGKMSVASEVKGDRLVRDLVELLLTRIRLRSVMQL